MVVHCGVIHSVGSIKKASFIAATILVLKSKFHYNKHPGNQYNYFLLSTYVRMFLRKKSNFQTQTLVLL